MVKILLEIFLQICAQIIRDHNGEIMTEIA